MRSSGEPTGGRQEPEVGVVDLDVAGFRSARRTEFAPKELCALVGEAETGKSTLLAAIRAVLDPEAAPLLADDVTVGESRTSITARLATGATFHIERPPLEQTATRSDAPPVVYMPASERASQVLAPSRALIDGPAADAFKGLVGGTGGGSTTSPALDLVEAIEQSCATGISGMVLLIEEPELYLRPQSQRYLYRLLRQLSRNGNQVIYSTHSPSFLNVARLDELGFVTRGPSGSQVAHPEPSTGADEFRLLSEFDAERSEVFLARAAILVEGTTEKLALPFVFHTLGFDPDKNGITIVECGGKAGIPFVARICHAAGVPFLAIHDRDAPRGRKPNAAEQKLNHQIAELAGKGHTIVLEPDFEAAAGIRGHSHKPQRAWRRFASLKPDSMPTPLIRAAELAMALAEGDRADLQLQGSTERA